MIVGTTILHDGTGTTAFYSPNRHDRVLQPGLPARRTGRGLLDGRHPQVR
jgi:hypothetical protein